MPVQIAINTPNIKAVSLVETSVKLFINVILYELLNARFWPIGGIVVEVKGGPKADIILTAISNLNAR